VVSSSQLPAVKNLEIYQGDTFSLYMRLRMKDANGLPGAYLDLTGQTPKAEIRPTPESSTVNATFTCTLDNQIVSPGGITLALAASTTLTLANGVWDLQFKDTGGTINTYLRGTVTVTKEVTRGL
jgi:hypothetical protein